VAFWKAYGDRGLVVWGIASREPIEAVTELRDELGLTFPILMDTDGAVIDAYAQQAAFPNTVYPQDWIVGADGTILYVHNTYAPDEMRGIVEGELE
jgi:peroxiredoxin